MGPQIDSFPGFDPFHQMRGKGGGPVDVLIHIGLDDRALTTFVLVFQIDLF
jgi:hypothetical protein